MSTINTTTQTVTITNDVIETDRDGTIRWVTLTGTDRGTGIEFIGDEYGVTEDGAILDCDGCPMTEGDAVTIAVCNSI